MPVALGLRENWKQFTLLVIINAFVGGMVGLERTILPELAEEEFGIAATTSILSFIVVFGIAKAFTNYYAGVLSNRYGRKNLLVIGWLVGLPVPLILIWAPEWSWVIFANILLGINQGLTWSSTVVMKIDLVGSKQRGLAMGINESAGYLAVGAVAFLTGLIATEYGLRPYPFYLGIGFAVIGLLMSIAFVRDTGQHVSLESKSVETGQLKSIFWDTSLLNRNLGSITQAGFVNNLNDGMIWGLLPIILITKDFTLNEIGKIVAIYPIVWGIGQLFTGKMADHMDKKKLLVAGMGVQAIAIAAINLTSDFNVYTIICITIGVGTALVYPTFLAAISDYTHPEQRAESIGVFRLWRDLGYAFGAILTGVITDSFGLNAAVWSIAGITLLSGLIVQFRMQKREL